MMRTRIEQWYDDLKTVLNDGEIATGLTNGELYRPEWMAKAEGTSAMKIWDNEDNDTSSSWGFIHLEYPKNNE
jgi:hypothetical protein